MKSNKMIPLAVATIISLLGLFPHTVLAAPVNTFGDFKVNGVLESTGGIKFSDGSTLNTSGLSGLQFNVGLVVDVSGSNTGTINSGAIKFGSNAGGVGIGSQQTNGINKYGLDIYTGGTSKVSILESGYVGIGTRTPTTGLDVRLSSGNATYARFGDGNSSALFIIAGMPHLGFNTYWNNGYKYGFDGNAGYLAFSQDIEGGFSFSTAISGTTDTTAIMTPRMVITNDGSVGVGTISPTQKLEVSGTVKATAFQGDGSALTNMAVPRLKSTSYTSVPIPINGDKITFATHTFTPQQSGTVIARARGFCNMQVSTKPELVIIFIADNANALSTNTENLGVANAPVFNPPQGTTTSWTAENTFNVSSGVPITLYLAGSKPTVSPSDHYCSGTFTVEFYNASL